MADWPRCDVPVARHGTPCHQDAAFTVGSVHACAVHLSVAVREHHQAMGSPMLVRVVTARG